MSGDNNDGTIEVEVQNHNINNNNHSKQNVENGYSTAHMTSTTIETLQTSTGSSTPNLQDILELAPNNNNNDNNNNNNNNNNNDNHNVNPNINHNNNHNINHNINRNNNTNNSNNKNSNTNENNSTDWRRTWQPDYDKIDRGQSKQIALSQKLSGTQIV